MALQLQQDGFPYLPEPDVNKFPGITEDQQLREYLKALVAALREYMSILKADADLFAAPGLAGTKVYYVSDSSGGAVTRKLTFIDGLLQSET